MELQTPYLKTLSQESGRLTRSLATAAFVMVSPSLIHAQASPTAVQGQRLSAFAGLTGTFTGLNGAKNLGITAGIDLGFRRYYGIYPTVEARGTYPLAKGNIDSQENILIGVKLSRHYGSLRPYIDFLAGRGLVKYINGYPSLDGSFLYVQSASPVYSPGLGIDYDLSHRFSVKADIQLQHYESPVTPSGHLYAKPLTGALIYNFDFNRHPHR